MFIEVEDFAMLGNIYFFFGTWPDIELTNITILYICVSTFSLRDFVSATYTFFSRGTVHKYPEICRRQCIAIYEMMFFLQSPDLFKFWEGKWCMVCVPCLNFDLK